MPEGPEIRQAVDAIADAIAGHPAESIFFAFDHLKPYESLLAGVTVTAVEARGKAVLTRFANRYAIYSHNQLYGKWIIRRAHDYPDTTRQLRLAIHNARHSALLYSASDIQVLHEEEIADHPFLSRIGPDLLDPDLTVDAVMARFRDPRFARRRLGGLLLSQEPVAGMGNYLRSEVLFVSGLRPEQRPVDLDDGELERLATACLNLTRQSYTTRGITNDVDRARRLKAEGVPRRVYRHHVFARDGQPCWTCGTEIQKTEVGSRRLYYCPVCQGMALP